MLSKYRADIDGLRAVAVLLVLVFHFNLFQIGEAGFIGVDVFFVISGYLITAIVWRDLDKGEFNLLRFYTNRIRRLAPALLTVQVMVLTVAAMLLLPSEMTGLLKETIAAQTYVSNIYYWQTINYFGVRASSAFLLHTWSLGVEEQFYLIFPIFLRIVHCWARPYLLHALLGILVISFGLNIAFVESKPEAVFYLLPTRAWELVSGGIFGLVQHFFARAPTARLGAGVGAVIVLTVAIIIHRPDMPFPGYFALLPVLAAGLFLMAGTGEGNALATFMSLRPIAFFGQISYPLYLVHWPIHIFGITVLPDYSLGTRWLAFGISILTATAITVLIERPVRDGKIFATRRSAMVAYGVGVGSIVLLALQGWSSNGWRSRFDHQVLRIADVALDVDHESPKWDFRRGDRLETRLRPIGTEGRPAQWLIYGDSHAGAVTDAVSLWLKKRGEAGEVAFHSGCMPLLDTGSASCRSFNREIAAHAVGKNVLLVSVWRQPLDPGYIGRDNVLLEGREAQKDAGDALVRTVRMLRNAHSNVFIWKPLPTSRFSLPETMARSLLLGHQWRLDLQLEAFHSEMAFFDTALDRADVPASARVDPSMIICPAARCLFVRNGLPIYSDTNHPAQRLTPWFAELLGRSISIREAKVGVKPREMN